MRFFHATTRSRALEILRTKKLCSAAEPEVFVSNSRRVIEDYGDGTLVEVTFPVGVKPVLNDEFPSGRRDFSVWVGKERCVRLRSAKVVKHA